MCCRHALDVDVAKVNRARVGLRGGDQEDDQAVGQFELGVSRLCSSLLIERRTSPLANRKQHGLHAVGNTQLALKCRHRVLNRALGQVQRPRDFLVAQARRRTLQSLAPAVRCELHLRSAAQGGAAQGGIDDLSAVGCAIGDSITRTLGLSPGGDLQPSAAPSAAPSTATP